MGEGRGEGNQKTDNDKQMVYYPNQAKTLLNTDVLK